MGNVYFLTSKWECNKCGYRFLAPEPHPCPQCQKAEFEAWKKEKDAAKAKEKCPA